jgi:hypothetical protein
MLRLVRASAALKRHDLGSLADPNKRHEINVYIGKGILGDVNSMGGYDHCRVEEGTNMCLTAWRVVGESPLSLSRSLQSIRRVRW